MTAKNESAMSGSDRSDALLVWWEILNANNSENIEGRVKRFQLFASNLQKAYHEAYCQQMEDLFMANERLVRGLREFFYCRQPQEIIAAESNLLATFFEGASLQAKTLVDLTQKVQDCCATIACDAAEEVHKITQQDSGTKPAASTGAGARERHEQAARTRLSRRRRLRRMARCVRTTRPTDALARYTTLCARSILRRPLNPASWFFNSARGDNAMALECA